MLDREYKRNQEKIKEFLLTEKKNNQKTQSKEKQEHNPVTTIHTDQPVPSTSQCNYRHTDQPGPSGSQRNQPNKNPKQPGRKGTAPTKHTYKPNKDFEVRSKEAALAQSRLEKAKQRQKQKANSPLIQLDMKKLQKDKSVEIINLASDSSQGSPLQILTSDNPNAFMNDNPKGKDNSPTKRDAKIDKIIKRITNSPKKTTTEPEIDQIITIIPASTSTPIGTNKYTPQRDTDLKTTKPTGIDNIIEQIPTPSNDKTQPHPQAIKDLVDPPEERQDTNTDRDNIHTEEQDDDYSRTSSISSLNTADMEALSKIFD